MPEAPLTVILEKEIEMLEQLNQLSLLKKEAILNNDRSSLEEITLREEKLTLSFKDVNDVCAPRIQNFLQEKGEEKSNIPEDCKPLMAQLRAVALQLKINNQFNQEILQDAIGIVKFTIGLFTRMVGKGSNMYSCDGKSIQNATRSHLLDFKG